MPVVAVVGGVAAAASGVSAIAAAGGLAAMSTMAAVTAGLQVVAGVAGALGAITGNKTLQKIGMVAGLGSMALGGISALTSGPGASAPTGTAAGADLGGGILAQGPPVEMPTYDFGAGTTTSGGSFGTSLPDAATAMPVTQSNVQATDLPPLDSPSAPAPSPTPVEAGAQGMTNDSSAMRQQVTMSGPGKVEMDGIKAPQATGKPGGGLLDSINGFTRNNPELTKVITGGLGGAADAYTKAQAEKARIKREDEIRRRYNQSVLGQADKYAQ